MTKDGGVSVAVVGATGAVGQTILRVLEERRVPVSAIGAFASRARSEPLQFRGEAVAVRAADTRAVAAYDVVMLAGGDDASEALTDYCLHEGCIVIDNSATHRMRPDVPLVVPEINGHLVTLQRRLYPVANCTAIVLTMGLEPLSRVAGLSSVRVASYQAVSGAGKAGLDELAAAERAAHAGVPEPQPKTFVAPIARNVIPQVGSLDAEGDSGEERKVMEETRKILGLRDLHIAATTVRVPVRTAHSEVVFVETKRETDVAELGAAYATAPGIVFHASGIVTPRDIEGTDAVHVARLRSESGSPRHFQFWVVGDQLRKGAATNGVQILQVLLKRGLRGRGPLRQNPIAVRS
jgi:aspartate-semialdehyde dehydrogenase